jgi:hypothetical protein
MPTALSGKSRYLLVVAAVGLVTLALRAEQSGWNSCYGTEDKVILRTYRRPQDPRHPDVDYDGEDPRTAVEPWELPSDSEATDEPTDPAHPSASGPTVKDRVSLGHS